MATFASQDSGQERTEDPTPKRREEARREGRIPKSPELSAAVILLGATFLLANAGGAALTERTIDLLQHVGGSLTADPITLVGAQALLTTTATALLYAFAPFAIGLVILALTIGLVQSRGVVSTQAIEPKLSNLNPLAGAQRIFGSRAPFTLIKSIVKLCILGLVSYIALRGAWDQVISLPATPATQLGGIIRSLALKLALSTGFSFLALAGFDYAFEVFQFEKSLRMTKQEVVQEHKENEGNPLVKGRLRSLGQAMARRRMLQKVKEADVIITNPTHIAVALKYDLTSAAAPIVLAMGERKLAQRIKAIAKDANVPMVENKPLARALLATAKVGKVIPVDLFTAVAEVLAYVYRRRAMPAGWSQQ